MCQIKFGTARLYYYHYVLITNLVDVKWYHIEVFNYIFLTDIKDIFHSLHVYGKGVIFLLHKHVQMRTLCISELNGQFICITYFTLFVSSLLYFYNTFFIFFILHSLLYF